MPLDPRLRSAWETFLALIPLFVLLTHVGLWVLSGLTLGHLEGPFPIHFDGAGHPDRMADASQWWLLPGIGLGMLVVMLAVVALVRWLVRRHPAWINVPQKAAFLALPEAARLRLVPRVVQLLLGLVLLAHFVLLAVVRDTYRVARHEIEGLSIWKVVVLLALVFVWAIIGIYRLRGLILKEAAAQRAASGAPPAS